MNAPLVSATDKHVRSQSLHSPSSPPARDAREIANGFLNRNATHAGMPALMEGARLAQIGPQIRLTQEVLWCLCRTVGRDR
jgi:hypothetical protein